MDFDIQRILRVLPHRAPFLMLDRVVDLVPRQSARAIKNITANEPFLQGHFPGQPLFPNVLALEAMFQLTAVLVYASEPFDVTQRVVYFLGVEGARFRKTATPGDALEISIQSVRRRSNIWKCAGQANVAGVLYAEAEILAAVTEREEA